MGPAEEASASESRGWVPVAAQSSVAVGSALLGTHVGGDVGAALGAGVAPLLDSFFDMVQRRRLRRSQTVLLGASEASGLTLEELLDRLQSDPLHGELATLVLLAAQDAGTEDRLRALSRGLAVGALSDDEATISTEILYARALADLDSPHFSLLHKFTLTWQDLGLSDQDTLPPDGLTHHQVMIVAELGPTLDPVLAALLNHGLVEERHSQGGGMTFGGGGTNQRGQIQVTNFGLSLIERMAAIGKADSDAEPPEAPMPSPSSGGTVDDETCLVCGQDWDRSGGYTVGPWVQRPDSAAPNGQRLVQAPLCVTHKDAYVARQLGIGWCDDCRTFGEAGILCNKCGSRFRRVDQGL